MRRRWRDLVMALAVAGWATRAAAAQPDLSAPSVCVPPCPDGEYCAGNRCVRPTEQSPATSPPLPHRESPPPPPPGSAPTSGPQPAAGSTSGPPPSPPADATPPPVAPPPLPRLQHDGQPWTASTYKLTDERVKRGFLLLPFVGVHTYVNEEASAYQPGLRFGALAGGRLSNLFSLNGELIFDFSNVRGVSSSFHERAYHFVFSPLLDVAAGAVQLVVGPKLGIFLLRTEESDFALTVASEVSGVSAGVNGGLFIPVSVHTSIGVLLSFDLIGANRSCVIGAGGGGGSCGSPAAQNPKVLGMTAGILF